MVFIVGFTIICSAAAINDLREHRIPNYLIAVGILYGLVFHGSLHRTAGLAILIGRMLAIILALYLFFAIGLLGAGDVKLYSLLPLYFGTDRLLEVLLAAFTIAGLWAVVKMLGSGCLRARLLTLWRYISSCVHKGVLLPYGEISEDFRSRENTIPMSVPLLTAVILQLAMEGVKNI